MLDGGQSSQDQWKQPNPRGKGKEVSNVVGDLGSLLKEKRSTWQKSHKETRKREQEVLILAEELKAQASVELLLEVLDRRKQQEEEVNSKNTLPRGTERRDERVR